MELRIHFRRGPALVCIVLAVLFAISRSIPYRPDGALEQAVGSYLLLSYRNGRLPELQQQVSERDAEHLETLTDEYLNARVEYDVLRARGPFLPGLPDRRTVVHAKYRIVSKTGETLASGDRYMDFRWSLVTGWYHRYRSTKLFYLLFPL